MICNAKLKPTKEELPDDSRYVLTEDDFHRCTLPAEHRGKHKCDCGKEWE
jgi:hypothetical protein